MLRKKYVEFLLLFAAHMLDLVLNVEQTLIIDLGKNIREIDDNYNYNAGRTLHNNRHNKKINTYGSERISRNQASSRTQYTQPPYSFVPSSAAPEQDVLPNSISELKNLLRQMNRTFSDRINSLSKRVDRLDSNQNSFRRSIMAEWQFLNSIDKRIRLFNGAKNTWKEAEKICEANTGKLLHIESADENEQITDLLKAMHPVEDSEGSNMGETIYWIGMQTTFNISARNFTNFEVVSTNKTHITSADINNVTGTDKKTDGLDSISAEDTSAEQVEDDDDEKRIGSSQLHDRVDKFLQECAVISTSIRGKWSSRDCMERHSFICQL